MFMQERHKAIADTIAANGKITIAEITAQYGISDESARRDLRLLEQQGICKRTHGGAILPQQVSVRPPVDRSLNPCLFSLTIERSQNMQSSGSARMTSCI